MQSITFCSNNNRFDIDIHLQVNEELQKRGKKRKRMDDMKESDEKRVKEIPILIAHRGNQYGPNHGDENRPDYIDCAIIKGYNVEIDVWALNNVLYLGHDGPQYKIELEYLLKRREVLWCHAKNLEAFELLLHYEIHCFYHDKDTAILTSMLFVWIYPGIRQITNSIMVMPEWQDKYLENDYREYIGICSDYVAVIREKNNI